MRAAARVAAESSGAAGRLDANDPALAALVTTVTEHPHAATPEHFKTGHAGAVARPPRRVPLNRSTEAHVDNEHLVRNWQAAILRDCRRILGRELTPAESAFVTCRSGFIALQMIQDEVRSLAGEPDELQRYLRSEARSTE